MTLYFTDFVRETQKREQRKQDMLMSNQVNQKLIDERNKTKEAERAAAIQSR